MLLLDHRATALTCFFVCPPQAAEYETTLANITELEEALALAQDQVRAAC